MKTVEIIGPSKSAVIEVADPEPFDDFVVVRIETAPMCTEYKLWMDGGKNRLLGHEAAGVVERVAETTRVNPGDRVVVMPLNACGRCPLCLAGDTIYCRNNHDMGLLTGLDTGTATYAEQIVKQAHLLVPIPDDISTDHASLACCGLGPTWGAMQRAGVGPEHTVLIAGLGPVGLGGVINAVYRNARVVGLESNPYRAELARALGAEEVFDPADPDVLQAIRAWSDGIDRAIDCSGSSGAQRILLDSLAPRGHLAFVGEAGELGLKVSEDCIRKGLTLHGCWHYNIADASAVLNMIRRVGPQLDRLVTHRFPLDAVEDAWALQREGRCGKVLLKPQANQGCGAA